jgi:hypothetical protein
MTLLWQASASLSEYFKEVIASDASKEQIENAQPRDNITHASTFSKQITVEVN